MVEFISEKHFHWLFLCILCWICMWTHHKRILCLFVLFPLYALGGGFCVHVCRNLVSAGLCMLDWSDGPPLEPRRVGFTLPDRWEGIVLRRKWQNKVLSATHPFFLTHSVPVSVALSICLLLSFSNCLPISSSNSHDWSWQRFSHRVAPVNGELPVWCLVCVRIGGNLMDSAPRSFERACH